MYQAISGIKNYSLYQWGQEFPTTKKFFFQPEHLSSQIWCQKFFPLMVGGPLTNNCFSSLNMYQAKSSVKMFSLYQQVGWVLHKIYFSVWTCIKPNLVSKIFSFTGRGGFLTKIFFSSLNMYQAISAVKHFSLYWWVGFPWQNILFSSLNIYQAKCGVKNFSLY